MLHRILHPTAAWGASLQAISRPAQLHASRQTWHQSPGPQWPPTKRPVKMSCCVSPDSPSLIKRACVKHAGLAGPTRPARFGGHCLSSRPVSSHANPFTQIAALEAGTAAFTDSRGPQPATCRRQCHAGAAAKGRAEAEAASSGSRDGGAKETARVHAAPAGRREVAVTGAAVDVVEGLEGEGREGGWTVVRVGEGGGAARAWVWGVRSGGRRPC